VKTTGRLFGHGCGKNGKLSNGLELHTGVVLAPLCTPHTSDNQFSAMVSLAFSVGATAFLGSTVMRQHLAGNYSDAAMAFLVRRTSMGSLLLSMGSCAGDLLRARAVFVLMCQIV